MISPHTLCPRAQIRCTMAVHLTQAWTSHLGVQLRCCLIFVQNCPYITVYVTGGGSPQFFTILHRGGLQSLLQYYSFKRKEGYNPFSAVNKLNSYHFLLFNADLCLRVLSRIRKNVAFLQFETFIAKRLITINCIFE